MRGNNKHTLKKTLPVFLFALLAIGLIGGTVAWLTASESVTNEFSVGSFTSPETDPTDPQTPISIDGNLYEKSWDSSVTHKLLPGATFTKDPYVGIGDGSEKAIVYICVENANTNKVYFTINNGWSAVSGQTTAGSASNTYTSGVFKYNSTLDASSGDAWTTTPLFSQVVVAQDADDSDFTGNNNIVVKSFIHQAEDQSGTAIPAATIESAALTELACGQGN